MKTVVLENMKGITDLSPLAHAPALQDLGLIDMVHLNAEDLRPLVGHSTLKNVGVGFGSDKKNKAGYEVIGLPSVAHYPSRPSC
jgi:hypothetical protein